MVEHRWTPFAYPFEGNAARGEEYHWLSSERDDHRYGVTVDRSNPKGGDEFHHKEGTFVVRSGVWDARIGQWAHRRTIYGFESEKAALAYAERNNAKMRDDEKGITEDDEPGESIRKE